MPTLKTGLTPSDATHRMPQPSPRNPSPVEEARRKFSPDRLNSWNIEDSCVSLRPAHLIRSELRYLGRPDIQQREAMERCQAVHSAVTDSGTPQVEDSKSGQTFQVKKP